MHTQLLLTASTFLAQTNPVVCGCDCHGGDGDAVHQKSSILYVIIAIHAIFSFPRAQVYPAHPEHKKKKKKYTTNTHAIAKSHCYIGATVVWQLVHLHGVHVFVSLLRRFLKNYFGSLSEYGTRKGPGKCDWIILATQSIKY